MTAGKTRTFRNAIMPVYRGDEHWWSTLTSVVAARNLFDSVVLSFDGPTRHELAAELAQEFGEALGAVALVTPAEMSWVEHIRWLVDQEPISRWQDKDLLTLLAEDDLIYRDEIHAGLCALEDNDCSILFGPWENPSGIGLAPRDPEDSGPLQVSVTSAPLVVQRLTQIAAGPEVTSVAGISMRTSTFRSFVRQHGPQDSRPIFRGVRAEFLLATQPDVSNLLEVSRPIVRVQEHSAQGSKAIASTDWILDEGMYQLWITMTPQPMRRRDRVAAMLRLGKRIGQRPSLLLRLFPALRVFRDLRDSRPPT